MIKKSAILLVVVAMSELLLTVETTMCRPQLIIPSVLPAAMVKEQSFKEAEVISPYDPIFKEVCMMHGNDWRLMSAMAYHESRFKANATSPAGAQGMMQIMPNVAKFFDVSEQDLSDVWTNITVANLLVNRIDKMLSLPARVSDEDRMSLILASYNGGIGRVFDAQRLARFYGEDPYDWDVVAKYLCLIAQPEYYNHEVVRNGRFAGSGETLAYVGKVIGQYGNYCQIAAL
ncbi:MAG: transglycosylase SLT domain-containing protein [Rikenellaceae bacterium]